MRVPLSWLREYVDVPADSTPEDVLEALVRVGFEEEDVHRFEISGPVVVGQVVSLEAEPQSNGKTINWCQVDVGEANGGVRGIVCGAHNFVAGDKVVVTLPGAVLPGPFPIAARSTFGLTMPQPPHSIQRAPPLKVGCHRSSSADGSVNGK